MRSARVLVNGTFAALTMILRRSKDPSSGVQSSEPRSVYVSVPTYFTVEITCLQLKDSPESHLIFVAARLYHVPHAPGLQDESVIAPLCADSSRLFALEASYRMTFWSQLQMVFLAAISCKSLSAMHVLLLPSLAHSSILRALAGDFKLAPPCHSHIANTDTTFSAKSAAQLFIKRYHTAWNNSDASKPSPSNKNDR